VLLRDRDLMEGAGTGEFPFESLLKIVVSSTPCSFLTREGRLN
jgi:hypothetical protein